MIITDTNISSYIQNDQVTFNEIVFNVKLNTNTPI